jgi:hypothetical protein
MKTRIIAILTLIAVFALFAGSIQASEPTWLFTVPKAESLKKNHFNLGLPYIADNLELGLHGLKYSIPDSNIAIGFSFYPLDGPYIVFSPDTKTIGFNIGIMAKPNHFFAGIELPVSNDFNLIAEVNNGFNVGVRILPSKNWAIDLFMSYSSVMIYDTGYYKYKYHRIEIKEYGPGIGFGIAYLGRF